MAVVCSKAAEKVDARYDATPTVADDRYGGRPRRVLESRFSSSSGTIGLDVLPSSQLMRQGGMVK